MKELFRVSAKIQSDPYEQITSITIETKAEDKGTAEEILKSAMDQMMIEDFEITSCDKV